MFKAFKYRIYPNKKDTELINKHIGGSRFVYNLALETKINAYKTYKINLSAFDLNNQLPELKKESVWLTEMNSQTLQASIRNIDIAFKRFFTINSGFPKFKSKWRGKQSFHIPQNVSLKDNKLVIPKFKGGIKVKIDRQPKGVIKSATISRTSTGKYFVSILCNTGEKSIEKFEVLDETTVGVDLGLKDFLITSNGEVIKNPKYLKRLESRLKYTQSKYSKNKGKKRKYRLAILHEKVANQRKDFLHKQSSILVNENHSIAIEDLNVKGMMKNHKLAKAISDVGWGMFVDMLEYKSEWYGKNILQIGRFEPSSKTCSCCNSINKELTLKDREWTCKSCNTTHDRDFNAATNIKNFALENYKNIKNVSGTDTENQDELSTLVEVLTPETTTIAYSVVG